jgi:hypothetical protein
MTLLDITLCLALAARIHNDSANVRATARRLVDRSPKEKQWVLALVLNSHDPLYLVQKMLEEL